MFCIVLEFTGDIRKRVSKFLVENSIYYIHTENQSVLFFYDIILELQKHDVKTARPNRAILY